MFGLPFVFSRSGVLVGVVHFIVLGATVLMTMLALGEVAVRTPGRHQIIGYTKRYLHKGWEVVAFISLILGVYGALIAYLLGVGSFLHTLLGGIFHSPAVMYSIVFWLFVASLLFFNLRKVANAESILVVSLLCVIAVIAFLAFPHIQISHLVSIPTPAPSTFGWLIYVMPFGVVLFALGAAPGIPEVVEYLKEMKQRQLTKRVICLGMCIPMLVYVVFIFCVVGVTGTHTTESSILGLGQALGKEVLVLGSILGVLTMTSAFISLGLALQDVYRYDFALSHVWAWAAVVMPPLLIVLLHIGSFIDFLGFAGSLIGGLDGIIILKMYLKLHSSTPERDRIIHIPRPLVWSGMFVYALGILSEGVSLLSHFIHIA